MKMFLCSLICVSFIQLAQANQFDKMELYKEIQKTANNKDKKDEALKMISELMAKLDQKDPLYSDLSKLQKSLKGNSSFPLDKAIKFGTGTKEEIYCKGKGLVYLLAKHNDGTKSELKLISSNRKMAKDSYAIMEKGDWVYELDTEYREPTLSDSWLDSAKTNAYRLREVRNGSTDIGSWGAEWYPGSVTSNYSTTGNTPEPLPMMLGNDYHLWGAYDLGFKIKFAKGYKDSITGRESGAEKVLILKTKREVTEELGAYSYKDSRGNEHSHKSCFKVVSHVELDKLVKE